MKLPGVLAALVICGPAVAGERILPASPPLDGGGGHWGRQTEADWLDRRWNQMDVGPSVASSLQTPAGPVAKALSIRVEGGGVCFDTEKLNVAAAWRGGFLEFPPERFGLVGSPRAAGKFLFSTRGGWNKPGKFIARLTHGKDTILHYKVGGADVFERVGAFWREWNFSGATDELELNLSDAALKPAVVGDAELTGETVKFRPGAKRAKVFIGEAARSGEAADLSKFLEPGPDLWPAEIAVKGQRAKDDDAYVIDTIPVPYDNPYKALMFIAGVDFLPNGDAAVCTIHGDVWLVRGIDESLANVRWKRFATGLFQALGLKVRDGEIYVLGRDRITRLRDLNDDGWADIHENFFDGIKTSLGGHDYVTSLELDEQGRFYYVDPLGLHRVSRDGASAEAIATGWRNPNGLGLGRGGIMTVAPQEGEWTPASMICEVKPGGYYGYAGPRKSAARSLGYDAPLCYIPRLVDNSSGSQVWAPENWGPLSGRMLNLSYGRSSWMLVLRDLVDGQAQGGVFPLNGRFLSGAMRGAVRKQDGQLYVVGAKGWTSNALRDGSLQRVRHTGKKNTIPVELRAHADGLVITFSDPLDRETAADPQSYSLEQWNYRYRAEYGSPELSVNQPNVVGHDRVEVAEIILSADRRAVFLRIPTIQPVMQMTVKFEINDAAGEAVSGAIHHTIHRLRPALGKP